MSFRSFFILVALPLLFSGCSCDKNGLKLQIINVLDKDAYDDCHIKGSINIPFEDLESEAEKLNKYATTVVYCSNYQCTASKMAASILKNKNFKTVSAYEAGMADWYQKGLPLVGSCKASYLKNKNEKSELEEEGVEVISTEALKDLIKSMLAVNVT